MHTTGGHVGSSRAGLAGLLEVVQEQHADVDGQRHAPAAREVGEFGVLLGREPGPCVSGEVAHGASWSHSGTRHTPSGFASPEFFHLEGENGLTEGQNGWKVGTDKAEPPAGELDARRPGAPTSTQGRPVHVAR